jgi:hypothetical protein
LRDERSGIEIDRFIRTGKMTGKMVVGRAHVYGRCLVTEAVNCEFGTRGHFSNAFRQRKQKESPFRQLPGSRWGR